MESKSKSPRADPEYFDNDEEDKDLVSGVKPIDPKMKK